MATHTNTSAYEELAKGFERNTVFPYWHSYDLYRKWLESICTQEPRNTPDLSHAVILHDEECQEEQKVAEQLVLF